MRGLSPNTNYLWDEILSFIAGYDRWDPKKAAADLENPTLITNFFSSLEEKLEAVDAQLRAIEEARVRAEIAAERARVAEEKKAAEVEEARVAAAAAAAAEKKALGDVEGGVLGEGVLAEDFAEVEVGEVGLAAEDDMMGSGGEAGEVEVVEEEGEVEEEEEEEELDEGDGGGESSSVTVTRAEKRGRKKNSRPNKTSRPIRDLTEDEARDL